MVEKRHPVRRPFITAFIQCFLQFFLALKNPKGRSAHHPIRYPLLKSFRRIGRDFPGMTAFLSAPTPVAVE
jgi:hypothetical protein